MDDQQHQNEAADGRSDLTAVLGALPCPFCGSTKIGFADGSTFRWLAAVCENCGAQAEEVRIDTLMPCRAAAEANAKVDALKAWNTRAPNAGNQR